MTEVEAKKEMDDILDALHIRRGDCVMLGIDMGRIPLPAYPAALSKEAFREREQKWFNFVLTTLIDRLGAEGTILAPAYSYSCGKPGSIFNSETSRSEVGPFTEFFRSRPGMIRSLHPVFSVSGTGKYAAQLLRQTGRSGFGTGSPFGRFKDYGVKFLCLGVEIKNSITYIHHLEQCYGSPHRYHKRFDVEVYENGIKHEGEWYAYVGYRGIDYESDISSLQTALDEAGCLLAKSWKGNNNHVASIGDVDRVGYRLLADNAFAFVQKKLQLNFDDSDPVNKEDKGISHLVVKEDL